MKSSFLRRSQSLLAGGAIALTVSSALSVPLPAFANRHHDPIPFATMKLEISQDRWIEIDLSSQRLIAREGRQRVYEIPIATEQIPTGVFEIHAKVEGERSRKANSDSLDPSHIMRFHQDYALQGMPSSSSQSNINVPLEDAAWLYDWTSVGTTLVIRE